MQQPDSSALVTGASRGIGLGIAALLARKGFGLTVAARDAGRLDAVADELLEMGARSVVGCAGDLADEAYPQRLVAAHQEAFGAMTCLVLSAGVGTAGDVGTLPLRRFDKTVAVNVRAPFLLLQGSLPLLRVAAERDPERGAKIIAMASITGVYAERGLAAYGATKAALISLIEAVNGEESANGVCGTAISPGYVETDMSAWVQDQVPADQMIAVDDIVRVVDALVQLSSRSVIPNLVIRRATAHGLGA
jgi:3-oxoacyl-[acyl-carrier protein] reductase